MKLGEFRIQTTGGWHVRRGIVGEHWAALMEFGAPIGFPVRTTVTDLASGRGALPIRINPFDAVLLIQHLDARGPASTTDAALNADVVEMLRPYLESEKT